MLIYELSNRSGYMLRDHGGLIGRATTLNNAKLIVRAVNSHDALVEALEEMLAPEWYFAPQATASHMAMRSRAREALKKARA